ncbi:MAG: TetR/AcrR family transcriptional regulator [Leptospiraceae bacterium]|nr:TetR/AcrR family transcriptional regulator [Leptospiraceae bacterium]
MTERSLSHSEDKSTDSGSGGKKSRTQLRAEETRQTILNSAFRLFADEGYHKTSIRKIARDAEVSEALLYHYFENKQDLVQSVIVDRMHYFKQQMAGSPMASGMQTVGVEQMLRIIFDRVLEAVRNQGFGRLIRLLMVSLDDFSLEAREKLVHQLHKEIWDPIAAALGMQLQKEGASSIDPYLFFRVAQGSFIGYVLFQEVFHWQDFIRVDSDEYRDLASKLLAAGAIQLGAESTASGAKKTKPKKTKKNGRE